VEQAIGRKGARQVYAAAAWVCCSADLLADHAAGASLRLAVESAGCWRMIRAPTDRDRHNDG
jgi:hypothetical protein